VVSGRGELEGTLVNWSASGGSADPRLKLFFAQVNGRAECVRIEIGAEFQPGENPLTLGSRFKSASLRPLDVGVLRTIALGRAVKHARALWVAQLEEIASGTFMGVKVKPVVRREAKSRLALAKEAAARDRPGEAPLDREHFEEVARIYDDALAQGERPTWAVKEHFRVSYPTAARYVSIARHTYHLLPKTRRGRAAGKTRRRGSS